MAFPRQQGIPMKCDSFMKTRRMNQTESYLLEERLKVLDNRKNQRNSEFIETKNSLYKQMEEIKTVRKNLQISPERRKLLRSQGFTIDTSVAKSRDDAVAIKKYSMPELSTVGSPRTRSTSMISGSELIMKGFPQLRLQESEDPNAEEEFSRHKAQFRTKHHFRVIEPPCRQGSRRNFVQISSDELKEIKKKEDEKSGEDLLDHNVKVDYRGMIRSQKKSSRTYSHFHEVEDGDKLNETRFMKRTLFPQDKQTKIRPSSGGPVSLFSKEKASVQNPDLPENIDKPSKLMSKSCGSLDEMTEARKPDSNPDSQQSVSREIKSGNNHKMTSDKRTRQPQSAFHKRKHGVTAVRVAFVEPQNGTNNLGNDARGTLQQPSLQCDNYDKQDENYDKVIDHRSAREKSATKWQKNDFPVIRLTLPSESLKVTQEQDHVKCLDESHNVKQRRHSSVLQSPSVRKSKTTSSSPQQGRLRSNSAVSYAYDARPRRSLCKGYVTMQMTIKGKQVKVHIPKFPRDADSEPIVERAKKKAAEDRLQSKIPQRDDLNNDSDNSHDWGLAVVDRKSKPKTEKFKSEKQTGCLEITFMW